MGIGLLIAILLAVAILPSALNIPQSNPNTVPEYAPIPPDEKPQTDVQGNLAAVGQAKSDSLASAGGASPQAVPTTGGRRRGGKRCVGNPPRQTEDPMSPPCVAFFDGDNGGGTYQGVTGDEVVVVLYWDSIANQNVGDGVETGPTTGSYCDIDSPPNRGGAGCYVRDTQRDHSMVRWARSFSNFFNDRYQTYRRRVHFWAYWGPTPTTAETKLSIAAEHYQRLKPFAALDQTIQTKDESVYLDAMARRNVMVFRGTGFSIDFQPASVFQRYAPQLWDFSPDIEHWSEQYITYVCNKVAGYPVAHTVGTFPDGRPMGGNPRKYAFLSTTDPAFPGVQQFAQTVKAGVRNRCGVDGLELFYPTNTPNGAALGAAGPRAAADNVAKMRQAEVTTVLWLAGGDKDTGDAADASRYYPEILHAGDQDTERNFIPRVFRNRNWSRNAWVVTNALRFDSLETDPRYLSCKETDPTLSRASCGFAVAFQRDYFMLFAAIQSAGPKLNPRSVDLGFHALPAIRSSSPFVASCFFDPRDYSCVKDAMHEWWDPDAPAPDTNQPGCWKMIEDGKRYLAGQWPRGDDVFPNTTDRCNAFSGGGVLEP